MMPTPQAYDKLLSEYEELRLAAIRVCVSEHEAQCADPAPEISRLWDLVGDFTEADLEKAEKQAAPEDNTPDDSWWTQRPDESEKERNQRWQHARFMGVDPDTDLPLD